MRSPRESKKRTVMVLEGHPEDNGVVDAIAKAAEESELERIAEEEAEEREACLQI